ncbi:MAG: SRPBCC family protein [Patescibacteria group bacterium]
MAHVTTTIDQTVIIPATPEEVYRAYTDPEEHAAFTGAEASGEAKVGEPFTAWGGYIEGTYLELVPNQKIVQEWSTSEWPEGYPPSRLEITLTPHPDGTELHLVQTEVPTEQAPDYEDGWHTSYWQPLTAYLEEHKA